MSLHVLRKTDNALKAFFIAAGITGLTAANICRTKETAGKSLPVLILNSETAARKRAKNWEVSGTLLLKTDPTTDAGADNLDASDAMEDAVIEALETLIPIDDRPQPLADAITAAAVASADAWALLANEFMMTACTIGNVSAGFDEDEIWTLSVDFKATVIA
jgi:hypothetical protein